MRLRAPLLLGAALLAACGGRQVDDGDGLPDEMPAWSVCGMKDGLQSCAEICEAQGTQCVANACPADPEFCKPESCDMATQVLGLDSEALCADASLGTFVATTCEAPIDWLFSNTARCCCAD